MDTDMDMNMDLDMATMGMRWDAGLWCSGGGCTGVHLLPRVGSVYLHIHV